VQGRLSDVLTFSNERISRSRGDGVKRYAVNSEYVGRCASDIVDISGDESERGGYEASSRLKSVNNQAWQQEAKLL